MYRPYLPPSIQSNLLFFVLSNHQLLPRKFIYFIRRRLLRLLLGFVCVHPQASYGRRHFNTSHHGRRHFNTSHPKKYQNLLY